MPQQLKKLVMALATIGMVAFLLNILVDNPYSHRLVRAGINEKVEEYTNLTLDFQALKISMLPLGVDLYGLNVATKIDPKSPLVAAGHVGVRLSLWSLIVGKPKLGLVESRDLTLIWPPPWNFPGFLKNPAKEPDGPTRWPPDFELPIEAVSLRNARIYFETPLHEQVPLAPESFVLSVIGADIDVTLDDWTDMAAALHLQSVNAALGAASLIEETAIDTEVELNDQRLATRKLKIDGERLKLDGSLGLDFVTTGREKILQKLALAVDGDVQGDLSLLGSYLDLSDTRGRVAGKAGVKATIPVESQEEASFLVDAQAKINDGYLAGFRLFDSAGKLKIDGDGIEFPELDVMIGDKSYGKASGSIKFNDAIDYAFKAKVTDLHLIDLLDAVQVPLDTFDLALSAPDLVVKGKGSPFVLTAEATAQTDEFRLPKVTMDFSKFPASPACRFDFHLAVTSELLDFNGTQGQCYEEPKGEGAAMPKAGSATPPAGAANASPLVLAGQIFFSDTKSGMALVARSDALQAELGQYFAQIPLSGKGQVEAQIKGPFDHIMVEAQAHLAGTQVMKIPLGRVRGKATVDVSGERVNWRDVKAEPEGGGTLESPAGTLQINDQLSFRARLGAQDVQPEAVRAALDALSPGLKLSFGIDKLAAELEGPLLYPGAYLGQVRGNFKQAQLDGQPLFDSLQTRLHATPDGISADHLVAALGDLRLSARFKHKHAFPFSFAEASQTNDPWAGFGLHPDDTWEAEFATLDDKETIEAASQPPSGQGARVGTAPATPAPDHLAQLPYAGTILEEANIKGLVSASGKLNGTTKTVQGTFKASLLRPVLFGAELAPVNAQGFVNDSKINLLIDHAGNSLRGRLSLDLLASGIPYEWYFDFNRFDLRAFGTEFFFADPRNYAYLTANWRMKGKFADWWRSTGELDVEDVRAKYVRDIGGQTKALAIKQEQPVKLLLTEKGWRFQDDKDLFLSGQYLQLRMSLPDCNPPEKLSVKLEGLFDVAIAKAFTTAVDTASGKLKIAAAVTGPVTDPKFDLEVTDLKPNPFIAASWAPVTLGLADVRPAFRNVKMRVLVQNGRLVIDSFAADKGSGTVTATGALNLAEDAVGESRIDVTLSDATVIFQVPVVKSFETQLSGNVSVAGSRPPFKVTGDVKVAKARSTAEVDIRNEIINALRKQSFKTSSIAEEPLVQLDLNVVAERSIQINNRNLQTVLSSNLQIKGTDAAPVVLGQVEVDKGKFIYKRDFNIVRGLVTFDDPVKPDPTLDILASSEVESYRVYIAISGRASNPTVEFSADPPTRPNGSPLSKLDILVLLSRGSLPEENRSIGQSTQIAAASEALNLIMGQFEEPVEKLFDLSGQSVLRSVYIDTYPSEEGKPVPRLNFPLDLGEDFDVVVRADQSTSQVSAEYNIHDNITFSSSRELHQRDPETKTESSSPANDTKFNLRFRFSFE